MVLQETNDKYFDIPFSIVLAQDSVLLARLFVKYFRKQGFVPEMNPSWNNDLSAKYGKDSSYRQRNWQSDSFNNGINFRLKDNEKDEYNKGYIQIGLDGGYAFVVVRYLKQNKKYKISTNKTVKEFIKDIVDKYKALRSGNPDENEDRVGTTEISLAKLFLKKGFSARYSGENLAFYINTNDLLRTVSEKTNDLIVGYNQNNNNGMRDLATRETIDDFIKIARYVVKRMEQLGYAYYYKSSSFHYNSSVTISLYFSQESDSKKVQEKHRDFEEGIESLQSAEARDGEELADFYCRKMILDFFTDDYKFKNIATILEHI